MWSRRSAYGTNQQENKTTNCPHTESRNTLELKTEMSLNVRGRTDGAGFIRTHCLSPNNEIDSQAHWSLPIPQWKQ